MTGPLIDMERGERRKERPALVEALAARIVVLEAALRDYLEWGAMTGSDRDLFHDRFTELLANAPKREGT